MVWPRAFFEGSVVQIVLCVWLFDRGSKGAFAGFLGGSKDLNAYVLLANSTAGMYFVEVLGFWSPYIALLYKF